MADCKNGEEYFCLFILKRKKLTFLFQGFYLLILPSPPRLMRRAICWELKWWKSKQRTGQKWEACSRGKVLASMLKIFACLKSRQTPAQGKNVNFAPGKNSCDDGSRFCFSVGGVDLYHLDMPSVMSWVVVPVFCLWSGTVYSPEDRNNPSVL